MSSSSRSSSTSSSPSSLLICETSVCEEEGSKARLIQIRHGDICFERVDAIVNAANEGLVHGGGVAGAIRRNGGDSIQNESAAWIAQHGPVLTGKAAFTSGGKLPCTYVIHAVGPIWMGGTSNEANMLQSAVLDSLRVASILRCKSISIPAISSGIFGFPKDLCARILIKTVYEYLVANEDSSLVEVRLTNFDAPTVTVFEKEFAKIFGEDSEVKKESSDSRPVEDVNPISSTEGQDADLDHVKDAVDSLSMHSKDSELSNHFYDDALSDDLIYASSVEVVASRDSTDKETTSTSLPRGISRSSRDKQDFRPRRSPARKRSRSREPVSTHERTHDSEESSTRRTCERTSPDSRRRKVSPGQSGKSVFIAQISYDATKEEILDLLEKYGKVVDLNLLFDHRRHQHRGFAFAEMDSAESARRVVETLNGSYFVSRPLQVEYSRRGPSRGPLGNPPPIRSDRNQPLHPPRSSPVRSEHRSTRYREGTSSISSSHSNRPRARDVHDSRSSR